MSQCHRSISTPAPPRPASPPRWYRCCCTRGRGFEAHAEVEVRRVRGRWATEVELVGRPVFFTYALQLPGTSALSARSAAGPALASSSVRARARGGDIKRLSIAARRDARHAEARECRRRAHVSASDDGRTQRKPNSCDGVRMFPENVAQTRAEGRGREAHLGL